MDAPRSLVVDTSASPHAKLVPVAVGQVKVEDQFWTQRIETLRSVTLPSQHELLEQTGRIDNFRRASRRIRGDFQGLYFNDSDVYKWVEAVCWALAYEPSAELKRLVDGVIDEIVAAQDEDGYLNTYFTFERTGERWSNLRDMHELYCAGHLIHAAVAHHRATGETKLLDAARRFADLIHSLFGPGRRDGVPGHPEPEMALVELYRETGDERYLETAAYFIDARGRGVIGGRVHELDHQPFREMQALYGHAVRAMYLCAGAADVAMENGDRSLVEACLRLWENTTQRRMYVTGGVGARHAGEAFGEDYELPSTTAYAETCAAIGNIFWNFRMLLLTGEARFADVLELALYNGALAGISLDGRHYFYVNPLADRGGHRRQPWFDCACCPPNIARLIASLPGYIYCTSPEGLWVNLLIGSSARASVGGVPVAVTLRGGMTEMELLVQPEAAAEFAVNVRVPGWSRGAEISVDDGAPAEFEPGSYAPIKRTWPENGTAVHIRLRAAPELLVSHPWVEATGGRCAIRYGPFIFCVEGPDNPGFDVWDLFVDPSQPLEARWRGDLLGGCWTVTGAGAVAEGWHGQLYAPADRAPKAARPVRWTAVPYCLWANREAAPMHTWPNKLGNSD